MAEQRPSEPESDSGAHAAVENGTSRRGFIGCVTAAGAATALDQTASASAIPADAEKLTAEHFSSFIGETFTMEGDAILSQKLKLVSVDKRDRGARPAVHRDPFALLFRAESNSVAQQTCILRNPGMGATRVMLVPVQSDSDHCFYEAIYG